MLRIVEKKTEVVERDGIKAQKYFNQNKEVVLMLDKIDWQAVSPVIYIVLGLLVVGVIAMWPNAKDPGMLLLGAVLTRIKIPSK